MLAVGLNSSAIIEIAPRPLPAVPIAEVVTTPVPEFKLNE